MEIHFLLSVPFIFSVPLLVPHRTAIFLTSLSTVICRQPLLWQNTLLVLSILLKNKELKREEDITGLLEVIAMEGCLMEGDDSRELFGFAMAVLSSTRRPTTVKVGRDCFATHLDSLVHHI